MAIVRSNAFPGTVFNPRLPRRTSSSPSTAMRGIVLVPRLTQFPNQEPLGRSMGEFVAAPELQQFPNGRPMRANPSLVLVDKQSLVKASLKRVLRKRCGLGDDSGAGAGIDPSGGGSGAGIDPGSGGYDSSTDIYVQPASDRTYTPIDTSTLDVGALNAAGLDASALSRTAGGTPTTSAGSVLTNLLNSIFGTTAQRASGYTGASGLAYNVSSGLNQPISAGSSITNGGVLLAGGIFLFLFLTVTGKKR